MMCSWKMRKYKHKQSASKELESFDIFKSLQSNFSFTKKSPGYKKYFINEHFL